MKDPTILIFILLGLVAVTVLLPLGIYQWVLGSVPTLQAAGALEMLNRSVQPAVLVDVRGIEDYQQRHIAGSFSLPLTQIMAVVAAADLPPALLGKTLLLVCDAGIQSAQAARHLHQLGVIAYNVQGGIQDWGRAWPQYKEFPYNSIEGYGGSNYQPFREMSPGQQVAAAIALLWIKPIYMLLSAAVGFLLVRQRAADLRLLGWGLLVFLLGEIFCAINYLLLKDNSYFAEYMHSYSMAAAFGLVCYALLAGLDERLIHFSQADKRCAMLPVCGSCVKYQPVRCGVRRMVQLVCVTMIILAFIPLLSAFDLTAYNTLVFEFNHYYLRPLVHQWFEARYSPAMAIVLFSLALLVMQLTPHLTLHIVARLLSCAGAGFLFFSLFRVSLGMIYADSLVWATFWEELTELVFAAAVICILWIFRGSLLPDFKPAETFKKIFT
ncbi:MAG: hypothetical protein A2Z16_17030 [Chloroflexi bacterium RBG_16_54_18]|nr:MAG: hypothetical protein A2Z16_17030 [Chloroflexi bacterium RBG_16_54_18]